MLFVFQDMREERISFTTRRGDSLCGIVHRPPGGNGAVILCHGMESSKKSEKLALLGRALAERGVLTLRFDFACAGESSGKFEDMTYSGEVEDLAAAYSFVASQKAGKIGILGSSMGGTVALLFAAGKSNLAAVVTIAAPVHPERFTERLLSAEELRQWRERGYIFYHGQRLNVSLLHDLEQIDVPQAARQITCPVLILHGDIDDVVPVDEAYELEQCLTHSKRLSILPGADHRLSDPSLMGRAISEAMDWLTKYIH